jgi:hypothetical protein
VNLFTGKTFWGKERILPWLTASSSEPKLLILDEYNLEDNALWSFFESLEKGFINYKGEKYPISNTHKIVCTCNPSYYPERKPQTTIPAQAITLYFKHPNDSVLHQIMNDLISEDNMLIDTRDSIHHIFLTSYQLTKKDHPNEVSLRDLQMLCQRYQSALPGDASHEYLAINACVRQFIGLYPTPEKQQVWLDNLASRTGITPSPYEATKTPDYSGHYVLPPSRQFVWQQILEDIALFRTGNLSAKGGILIEGPSGIGKTRMYIAALEQEQIPYDLISSGSKNVDVTLRNAFHHGRAVILDELNLDPGLEKLLGQYLTGVDEFGQHMKIPGFFVLASQNPTGYAARKKLAASFLNRFHRCVLTTYPLEELYCIAEKKLPDKHLAVAFFNAYKTVKDEGVYQINTRNFFIELDAFSKLTPDQMQPYRDVITKQQQQKDAIYQEINNTLDCYSKNRVAYYKQTYTGCLAFFFNPQLVLERLHAPTNIRDLLNRYIHATPDTKTADKAVLVQAIASALTKLKPRWFGNYAETLQYKLLLLLRTYPELNEEAIIKNALSLDEWNTALKNFETVEINQSSSASGLTRS